MTAVLSIETFNGKSTLVIVPEVSDDNTPTVRIPLTFKQVEAIEALDWEAEECEAWINGEPL